MATYAIGDIQGCYDEFRLLLKKIQFDPAHDRLWLAGDLVNRGPKSLKVLRYVYKHRDHCQLVLGNHDLSMLASYYTHAKLPKKSDFNRIFAAEDIEPVLDWLRQQPLAIYDKHLNALMVHAGVPPQWDLQTTLSCAGELEEVLRQADSAEEFFRHMYGNKPALWSNKLRGLDRLRYITNALTRMRFCHHDGQLDFKSKSSPGKQAKGLFPWYELTEIGHEVRLVFGHWAALNGQCEVPNLHAIDTGCVWGNKLTALRLEDEQRFSVKAIKKWS